MTLSEELFEKFCINAGIHFRKIQEGNEKSPDYELILNEQTVIAEVKEFDRNRDEKTSDKLRSERGYGEVLSNTPGDRIRKKIKAASPQIKNRTKGIYPSILVLFDRGRVAGHIDPYNIRVAMYGLELIHFDLPQSPGKSPTSQGMSYGPKRKMTETTNTSISAIAAFYATGPEELKLSLYHNKYASIPLDTNLATQYGIPQYVLEDEVAGRTSKWEIIHF